ncbi:DUF1189 family protein [Legionella maioricensis]|uniref:DUF1189 domain-containing protein n=1 Tax=Legionella maioricensis TaxID=2896528 RepID=A0A9X2IA24_9GAMM|nr:DUF1189 domain-containing protein [Legionella maioricensis]MCL9687463.1 DUF1189 domain-containing protein [Legionella maioricensis]
MAKAKNKLKLIDAPVYRYWEALYMSFYSRRLYVDVGKRWRGLGILYLLLAIAVLSIPFAVRMSINLNQSFNDQIIEPLLLLPPVYVQNGKASLDKPMPYLVKNKKNQVVLIVDTTGKIDKFGPEYPYLNILINKDKIYFKIPTPQLFGSNTTELNPGVPLSQSFGEGTNFVFSGKKIVEENNMMGLKYASELMIYPIVVAMFYSMFVVIFLVLAFLGQVFSNIFFSFKISFMQSSRLFLVATTPMLLVLMSLLTLDAIFPGLGFILLVLITLYFSFAVYSLKAESTRMANL